MYNSHREFVFAKLGNVLLLLPSVAVPKFAAQMAPDSKGRRGLWQCGFENRTSLYDFQREFLQSLTALQKRRLRTAFPASLPERIKGLFLGESTGRRPVQGKVRRVFDRKLGIKSIHGRMLFIGFLGRSPKRYLEDGRGFRGRKKLLVAKVSSFP